jgi:hypothetical protein
MGKNKKKRNRKYTGWDAKGDDSNVTVHKVTAVHRSPLRQWLYDHKKPVKIVGIALGVVVIVILMFTIKL